MDNQNISQEHLKSFLASLATAGANKAVVDELVIGDHIFDHDRECNSSTPLLRIDGEKANYYSFFKKNYLLEPTEELMKNDPELYALSNVLYKLFAAYEKQDHAEIIKITENLFDAGVKEKKEGYVEQAEIIEKTLSTPEFNAQNQTAIDECRQAMKESFIRNNIFFTFRRATAEVELLHDFRYPTLERNIESIINVTILHTERILIAHQIKCDFFSQFWTTSNSFCDFWFSATVSNNGEKSISVRQQIIEDSKDWPEYAQNMSVILDFAAIIQDRLFTNHYLNPSLDLQKDSFKIWNAYASAALRLGAIFNRYKHDLPFDDEILKTLLDEKGNVAEVITEGKTDWMHLKNAYINFQEEGRYVDLNIVFDENTDPLGQDALILMCQSQSRVPHSRPLIYIADSDTHDVMNKLNSKNAKFKKWGNNVFSFCIPKPLHRVKYQNISIEFYYSDGEIHTVDPETGRHLMFSNEIQKIVTASATHKNQQTVRWRAVTPIIEEEVDKKIFDAHWEEIEDDQGNKIACSKSTFAENIYRRKPGFDKFNLEPFSLIFDIISEIVSFSKNN